MVVTPIGCDIQRASDIRRAALHRQSLHTLLNLTNVGLARRNIRGGSGLVGHFTWPITTPIEECVGNGGQVLR